MSATVTRVAVFLDRDGTLIEDPGYLSRPVQVRLLPGVADALIALERAGFLRIMISNQSGIGRGHYPESAYRATQEELECQLRAAGATLDAAYYCPHAPDAGCLCRKPGTALHREAIARFAIDAARSWCIGDHVRDVQPAQELGCRAVLLRARQGNQHIDAALALGATVADDLPAAVALISRYT